jgi:hypothetical protein
VPQGFRPTSPRPRSRNNILLLSGADFILSRHALRSARSECGVYADWPPTRRFPSVALSCRLGSSGRARLVTLSLPTSWPAGHRASLHRAMNRPAEMGRSLKGGAEDEISRGQRWPRDPLGAPGSAGAYFQPGHSCPGPVLDTSTPRPEPRRRKTCRERRVMPIHSDSTTARRRSFPRSAWEPGVWTLGEAQPRRATPHLPR